MSSKCLIGLIGLLRPLTFALVLALAGCSLRLNETLEEKRIDVNPAKAGCLSAAPQVMEEFFAGKIEEQELKSYWDCLNKALSSFTENTSGKNEGYFTGDELTGFLTKYFLAGRTISPEFMREILLLKQGIFGGAADRVTVQELRSTLTLFGVMKNVSLRLRPYMPISVQSFQERRYGPAEFEAALIEFEGGFQSIGHALEGSQGTYSFERMRQLLIQAKLNFYPRATTKSEWLDTGLKWIDAFQPAKAIFVAPPQEEIRASDWSKIYYLAPRYYGLYMKMSFYWQSGKYLRGDGLTHIESLFTDFTTLFENLLDNHPNATIHSSQVDDFLSALERNELLPCEKEAARSFLYGLFGRLFTRLGASDAYQINRASLERLDETFRFATEGLRAAEGLYRTRFGDKFETETLTEEQLKAVKASDLLNFTSLRNSVSAIAVAHLQETVPLAKTTFTSSGGVYIPVSPGGPRHFSLDHLSRMHLLGSVNRLLMRAYGTNGGELSEAEVKVMAADLFPLFQSLGLVSKETRDSISQRLFEASLFLVNSDGNTTLTATEALELESLLLSTVNLGAKMQKEMAGHCRANNKDADGKWLVPSACFKEKLADQIGAYWSYIPGMRDYMISISRQERLSIFGRMDRIMSREKTEYNQSDTYSYVLMPYYVELIYFRFDRNHDGLLNNDEAEEAYSIFQPFLASKATEKGLTSPEDHHALYMFLLAYQRLPNDMKTTWIWRRYIWGDKNFTVDRGQILRIFERLLAK